MKATKNITNHQMTSNQKSQTGSPALTGVDAGAGEKLQQ